MRRELLKPVEGLNERQDLAISYWFRGDTKVDACVKAGYSRNSVQDVFTHPLVVKEIERRCERLREKVHMDKEYLLGKLKQIIDCEPGEMIEVDKEGGARLDWNRMTPELRRTLGKFTQRVTRGGGKYQRTTVETDAQFVTIPDRIAAIKEAANILGVKVQQVELTQSESLIKILTDRRKQLAEQGNDGNSGKQEAQTDGSGQPSGSGHGEPEVHS